MKLRTQIRSSVEVGSGLFKVRLPHIQHLQMCEERGEERDERAKEKRGEEIYPQVIVGLRMIRINRSGNFEALVG